MYEIRVLSNHEFDSLPHSETRGSDISDSMGFANKFTGRAYVRQTGLHELNKYLITHELEELESDESTHEDENGIRHKKGKNIFRSIFHAIAPVVSLIPGIGSIAGPAISAFTQPKQQQPEAPIQPPSQPGGFEGSGNQFSQFSPPSSSGGTNPTGGLNQGSLNGGGQNQPKNPLQSFGDNNLDSNLLDRTKGFFSGRLAF